MNVGCVPKKICHYGGLLGQAIKDAKSLGWRLPSEMEVSQLSCTYDNMNAVE